MNTPHASTAPDLQVFRGAARRKFLGRAVAGSLVVGLVAAVFAADRNGQGAGLFSKLGLNSKDTAEHIAWAAEDQSRSSGPGWDLTAGFYEFDDGPEEDVRKGRLARADLAQTNTSYFAADYYEDPDLAASGGFLGFWASMQLGSGGSDDAAEPQRRRGARDVAAEIADATPRFRPVSRNRTSKSRSETSGEATAPLFQKLFGSSNKLKSDSTDEQAESEDTANAEVKSDRKPNGFFANLFSARESEPKESSETTKSVGRRRF